MTAAIEDLKTAAELVEKATEVVREAARETSLPSEASRRFVREQVMRIRLKMMLIRRDLTILHEMANRRKPRGKGQESQP
jgi:hypothetical protein